MTYIIDSHEDIASNCLTFKRSILDSVEQTRRQEAGTEIPIHSRGDATLGWPEYQKGAVALVFATLFVAPAQYSGGSWEKMVYHNPKEAVCFIRQQLDFYDRLVEEHPQQFSLVRNKKDLASVLAPWQAEAPGEHPVGLVILLEGAEGLESPRQLEELYERGLRMVGPVWAGNRYCAGTKEERPFDKEGQFLLEVMESLHLPLDISHMRESAALFALDHFSGAIFASHSNSTRVTGNDSPRHLSDLVIHRLQERGGVIGVIPYNHFLVENWDFGDAKASVGIDKVLAQIDYYCQMSGDSRHTAIGSDFDGGFGKQCIPFEMDNIADLQKIGLALAKMGYTADDIANILHNNWKLTLEKILPE